MNQSSEIAATSTSRLPMDMGQFSPDNISQMTLQALEKIKANPKQLSTILDQLEGNEEVLGQVLKSLEANPSLKSQALASIKSNRKTVQHASKLSAKDKRQMLVQAKRAKAAASPNRIQALVINNSRQIKSYQIAQGSVPPARHSQECCRPLILGSGLELHYCRNAVPLNKKAESIFGFKMGGEVVVVHKNSQGHIVDLEESLMLEMAQQFRNASNVEGKTDLTQQSQELNFETQTNQVNIEG